MIKIKLKKKDIVKVISGNDKGKTGEIIQMFPKSYSAMVKGMNIKKKHQKPTKEKKGGIISIEKPINISNLSLVNKKEKSKTITKNININQTIKTKTKTKTKIKTKPKTKTKTKPVSKLKKTKKKK